MPNVTSQPPTWLRHSIAEQAKLSATDSKVHVLVAGEFGVGKTHFANTFPKPFWLDFDHGMATARSTVTESNQQGLRFYKTDPIYATTLTFLNDCMNRRGILDDFETIVLDGYTALSHMLMYEVSGGNPDPKEGKKGGYDEYGSLRIRLNSITDALRAIPYHVCATILATIDKDEATGSYVGIFNTVGGFRHDIGAKFDEVYLLEKRRARSNEPGNVTYEAFTELHPRYQVKSRLATAAKIPGVIPNPSFGAIYAPA